MAARVIVGPAEGKMWVSTGREAPGQSWLPDDCPDITSAHTQP